MRANEQAARGARTVVLALAAMLAVGCGGAQVSTQKPKTHKPAQPGTANSEASSRCRDLLPLIQQAADEAHVDPALLVGVVRTESNFRNDARSGVGAIGLTQCMRATAKAKRCGDLDQPIENLRCGARVLAAFLEYYGGNVYLGLSGYNAGHSMPDRAKALRILPSNVEYVEDVLWARSRYLAEGCAF